MKQLLWLGLLSLTAACSKAPAPQAPTEPSAQQQPGTTAEGSEPEQPAPAPAVYEIDLLSLFGAQIQLAADLPANELRGDFSGDGIEDRAYLISTSSLPPNLAPDIRVIQPFEKSVTPGIDVKRGSPISLVLVNGGPNFPTATVLVNDQAVDGRLAAAARLGIRLIKQADVAAISPLAKGDAVALPSQGGTQDVLYWDGTGFQLARSK
jgi:hypothetical protein